jgi:hypothetical protein
MWTMSSEPICVAQDDLIERVNHGDRLP